MTEQPSDPSKPIGGGGILEDAQLVRLAKGGAGEAFGVLVVRHERAMLAIARAYFACEADARDAVQDAFVKAYNALGKLECDERFAAWLARITSRTCLDVLRSQKEKVSLTEFSSTIDLRPRSGGRDLTPATLSCKNEEAQFVRAAVGRLPEEKRVILMLRYSDGMSYDKIAQYLGLKTSTVRGRLVGAKKALQKVLKGTAPPPK
ncbi:sigma-70 family RNA polymerase sigma factor [bacterium]|nr:sigma-70 family RNA polymerase sigma factor [bacterium]